jgi:hypothetical protein
VPLCSAGAKISYSGSIKGETWGARSR